MTSASLRPRSCLLILASQLTRVPVQLPSSITQYLPVSSCCHPLGSSIHSSALPSSSVPACSIHSSALPSSSVPDWMIRLPVRSLHTRPQLSSLQALVFLLALGSFCSILSGTRAGDTREADPVTSDSCQVRDSISQPPMESEGEASLLATLCRTVTSLSQIVQGLYMDYAVLMNQRQPIPSNTSFSRVQDSSVQTTAWDYHEQFYSPEPRVPLPERFSGNRKKFRTFQNSCELYFSLLPRTFSSEKVKVGFLISLLLEEPQAWAHQLREQQDPALTSVASFFAALSELYADPFRHQTAETMLSHLQQGQRPVEDYVSDFRLWCTDTRWNNAALRFQFRLGLSDAIKDELARIGSPAALNDLIHLSIQIDRRLRERQAERSRNLHSGSSSSKTPLSISITAKSKDSNELKRASYVSRLRPPLSEQERARRRHNNLCLYCGDAGHFLQTCPRRCRRTSSTSTPSTVATLNAGRAHTMLPLFFQLPEKTFSVPAIVDSGACSCFIDSSFAAQHELPLCTKRNHFSVHLADGSGIKSGPVTQETIPILCRTTSGHQEFLRLDVISSPLFPVILGQPWLRAHNPLINWSTGEVVFHSDYCKRCCLPPASGPEEPILSLTMDPETTKLVPTAYHEYLDVFSKKNADTLPPHRPYDCPIELLPGAEIPFGRIYPLSELELKELRNYIDENLDKGFIRPSSSPAGAGIFFVEKKDGSLRPCIDYRDLNKVTIKNRYPLPLIPELFQRLREARVFSKLDLRGAYNLIRIREGDEWKTAFRSRFGHFEYLVMPFGLCNAPATFQHFVNDVFRDFLDVFTIVYLDDILIFSSSLETHRVHVKRVLSRLREHRLYAKSEKCEFEKITIQFLGLVISADGIAMDPQKVSAILDWPTPADKKAVQRFVGFANFYRKFIKDFSGIISPITQLTKLRTTFSWTPEAQGSFERLKGLFTSAPILRHPDPALPFILEVDASEIAVGAILSQRQGTKSLLHPVAFFSRKLSTSERNYDVGDRELLAIKSALEEWRYLLEGAAHPILVFTDHKNLEYLRAAKRLRPRQARWALFFSRFCFHITYRPGSKNGKPDALSRMFQDNEVTYEPDTILPAKNFLLLQTDVISQIRAAVQDHPPPQELCLQLREGLYFHREQIFVPEQLRTSVLYLCHDHPLAGHFGVHKTSDLVLRSFWWPSLLQDCRDYVRSCPNCLRNKSDRSKNWGLLEPLPVPKELWSMISMDFIVELPPSEGFTTIFVVVDRLSKMAHFVPLKGTPSASETASSFVKEIVRLHGVPNNITSDRGVQFTSRFWKAMCEALGIKLCLSSAYHPQTNGQTERTNQTLEQYLRCFSSFAQDDWVSLLPLAEFAYNNSVHSAIKQSPFFANYGFHPAFLPDIPRESSVPAVQDRLEFWRSNNQFLQEAITKSQTSNKRFYDKKKRGNLDLKPGDKVWLSSINLKLACPSRKLGPRYIGPFPIRRKINAVAFELILPENLKIHPVFHVSLLKKYVVNPFPNRESEIPPPLLIEGNEEFEVETILDCRKRRGQTQFLIKWKGYGPEDNSWEPSSNVHAPRLIRAFLHRHPEKISLVGIRRLPLGRGQCQGLPVRRLAHRLAHRRTRIFRNTLRGAHAHRRTNTRTGARTGMRTGARTSRGARCTI